MPQTEIKQDHDLLAVHKLDIDPQFTDLIPIPSSDELERLEHSLLNEGCRETLDVWGTTIVDGHNRYRFCHQHNIPFRLRIQEFADRNEAILWMVNRQLSRRNLTDYQRGVLVLREKTTLEAQAKERQREHGGTAPGKSKTLRPLTDEVLNTQLRTDEQLARKAGMGKTKLRQIEIIEEKGDEDTKGKAASGEIKVGTAFKKLTKGERKSKKFMEVTTGRMVQCPHCHGEGFLPEKIMKRSK